MESVFGRGDAPDLGEFDGKTPPRRSENHVAKPIPSHNQMSMMNSVSP
jgi:hypothetical protein